MTKMLDALRERLFGKRTADRAVDRVIDSLERGDREIDRRLEALRAQVQAQTRWRREREGWRDA